METTHTYLQTICHVNVASWTLWFNMKQMKGESGVILASVQIIKTEI